MKLRLVPIVFLCILNMSVSVAWAQEKPFTPEEIQDRFFSRLSLLVEYEKSLNWEKVWELLSERDKKSHRSKEKFVALQRKYDDGDNKLVGFTTDDVSFLLEAELPIVIGCGEFLEKGKSKRVESIVEAYYENKDWYFSPIRQNSSFGKEPPKCKDK